MARQAERWSRLSGSLVVGMNGERIWPILVETSIREVWFWSLQPFVQSTNIFVNLLRARLSDRGAHGDANPMVLRLHGAHS